MKPIPWFGVEINSPEKKRVLSVLNSDYINDGDVTRQFEAAVAAFIGARYCVATTSGTSAIALALMAVGVGPGDEVIVPDLTFIATANAVRLTGATVKLVDVEPQRLSIDPEKIEKAITRKTKAIVPVDVNGRAAFYEIVVPLAKRKGIHLISDSAEALGSKYRGKFLGTFGDAGCFSFSPNKMLTTGQGGMVATNDKAIYHRLLELKDQGRRVQGSGGDDQHPVMGFNFKLTNIQSAIGLGQLQKLAERLEKSRLRENLYRTLLFTAKGIAFPDLDSFHGERLQWSDALVKNRAVVTAALDKNQIGYRRFWHPLHTQKPYAQAGRFPVSTKISQEGLWLPSSFNITTAQVRFVCRVIQAALN